MSSGAKIVTSYAVQADSKVIPQTGWKVLPYTSNTLNNNVELTDSETITDSRLKGSGLVTSGEVTGDIEAELMFGVFDDLLEGAFWGAWSGEAPNVLSVSDKKKMFAITKDFTDINVNHLFTACHVNTFKLDINTSDLIKVSFGFMGLGYQSSKTASFAINPEQATVGAKGSGQSIGTILINGEDVGVCVEALTFEIDNAVQVQKCLGDNIYGGNALPMRANITGSLNIAYSQKAYDILNNQVAGTTLSLEVPINFEDGKKYVLKVPKMQVSGEIPSPSATDLAVANVNFVVVEKSPILEKHTA